jgi:tricorn protease
VLAINDHELRAPENPWKLLRNAAGDPVSFLVNDEPKLDGAREVIFDPLTSDNNLRYFEWVEARRKMVEEATDGRVGYLHIPDMGSDGIQEFVKWYYGQIRKEGLVIDVRGNGGGNVSQMIIERLERELLRIRYVRTNDRVLTYPNSVFNGHMICLLNETSASDGDIFPAMFKEAKLGLLVGKRSWGGVTGITGHGPLLDGGGTFVPQFGTNSRHTGEYIIEGYGVDPDVVVENTPKSILEGRDLQLEKALELLMQEIKDDPKQFPPKPADPVRTN